MAASDNLSPQQFWYHGTNAQLSSPDLVDPKYSGRIESDRSLRGTTYFTSDQRAARYYGVQAARRRGGSAHVYQVEPVGEHAPDPDNATLLGDSNPRMSNHPLRVVSHVEEREPRTIYGVEVPWHRPGEDGLDAGMRNRSRKDRFPEF